MDWVNPPPVGGLKRIDVNWNVIIGRRGICHVTQSTHSVQLYVEMALSGSWSVDETRALLDM